jgi:hypothetical protein
VHDPAACGVVARGEAAAPQDPISSFVPFSGFRATVGLLDDAGLCLLAPAPGAPPASDDAPVPLAIRSFGSGAGLAPRLLDLLEGWEEAERPFTADLRISVYPKGAAPAVSEGEAIIVKSQTELVLRRP